jgi:hypothetical protein
MNIYPIKGRDYNYSPVNLSLKWQNINKIARESIALALTPENHILKVYHDCIGEFW